MSNVTEIWADTGKVIERDMNPDELAQQAADQAAAESEAQVQAEAVAAQAAATQAAIEHAKSLGFTDEMIAVMYPNLSHSPHERS